MGTAAKICLGNIEAALTGNKKNKKKIIFTFWKISSSFWAFVCFPNPPGMQNVAKSSVQLQLASPKGTTLWSLKPQSATAERRSNVKEPTCTSSPTETRSHRVTLWTRVWSWQGPSVETTRLALTNVSKTSIFHYFLTCLHFFFFLQICFHGECRNNSFLKADECNSKCHGHGVRYPSINYLKKCKDYVLVFCKNWVLWRWKEPCFRRKCSIFCLARKIRILV